MKRQNPKELTKRTFSFHYRLSSLVTLLTPAFCFLGFLQNQRLFPSIAGVAGAAGMLRDLAGSALQEPGAGERAGSWCAMGLPGKWQRHQEQGLCLPLLSTPPWPGWAINPDTMCSCTGFSPACWWLLICLKWHNWHGATHPLFPQIQRDSS